ncbi:13886_t:CDS:2 [Funneliformis geosporum]|nr:13886_t:CDS:2 [Funneliformis geosporum]
MDLNIEWIKTFCKDILFSIIHNTYQPQKGKVFCLASNKEAVENVQGIVRALKTNFSKLRIKEYHGKSDPEERLMTSVM